LQSTTDQSAADSPVKTVEEVKFQASHEYCETHFTFRVELQDGRQYAVNFADRQLGWLPLIVHWPQYVHVRIKLPLTCKQEILAGRASAHTHLSDCKDTLCIYVQDLGTRKKVMRETHYRSVDNPDLPPYDMIFEERPADWLPNTSLSDSELHTLTEMYKCRLEESVKQYFEAWKAGEWQ